MFHGAASQLSRVPGVADPAGSGSARCRPSATTYGSYMARRSASCRRESPGATRFPQCEAEWRARRMLRRRDVRASFGLACAEDLRQVDDRVTRHREGQMRLTHAAAVEPDDDERTGVEHRRERCKPRLVAVLRSEVRQRRIGEVALQYVGGPAFPVDEQVRQVGWSSSLRWRRSNSPADGGEPARESRRLIASSRRENVW